MKKSIIILGIALAISTNVSEASNLKLSAKNQINSFAYVASPLHYAVCDGDIESVKKCIKYGADVNKLSRDMSPLMLAARFNKFEIIKILLASGANPAKENEKGFIALNYAEYSKANESIAILKNLK
ncbi:ankyrin repeat protein [Flavobacterium sp. 90]|uniref:ankyrin repeat domain-containing protein n=1 Tax=unclassified Flavobacterium TaxID=196869 RepID=UPI000EABD49B|nr:MULTISPECIES: ankyrin repeat domain-containing protein [unclassified Flavobacterium]RKR05210.1 ankyrin repeat protein [Flavobacterium sp. 81]TCK56525.1 ankyrin repeat protein [Flavobacterium sp. 90]